MKSLVYVAAEVTVIESGNGIVAIVFGELGLNVFLRSVAGDDLSV